MGGRKYGIGHRGKNATAAAIADAVMCQRGTDRNADANCAHSHRSGGGNHPRLDDSRTRGGKRDASRGLEAHGIHNNLRRGGDHVLTVSPCPADGDPANPEPGRQRNRSGCGLDRAVIVRQHADRAGRGANRSQPPRQSIAADDGAGRTADAVDGNRRGNRP